MIYKNLIEEIPQKKRIRKFSNVHYVYEIISRKNKQQKKDKVVCVGIAIDETRMHPNDKYYDLHKSKITKKPLLEQKEFSDQIHIGANLITRKIANQLGLTNLLKEVFGRNAELLFSLSEYYLINRDTNLQLYKYYLDNHFTELNFVPEQHSISNFLNNFVDRELMFDFLTKWFKHQISHNQSNSKIDVCFTQNNANTIFDASLETQYGKDKFKSFQNGTVYFLDRESGLPIFFDSLYSAIDTDYFDVALDKIKLVCNDTKINFVLNSNYFALQNLDYIDSKNLSFVCIGTNTCVFEKLIECHPCSKICNKQNYVCENIYGIKIYTHPFVNSDKKYYVYLFHNEAHKASEIAKLNEDVQRCCQFLIGKKDIDGNISNTYNKFIIFEKDKNGTICKALPNIEYIENIKQKTGYFWIVSNIDDTLVNILKSYKNMNLVEKEFFYSKPLFDIEKSFICSNNNYEASLLISFICAILRSNINHKTSSYIQQNSGETSQTIINELDKIKCEEVNEKYVLKFSPTKKQSKILALFDLHLSDIYKMIDSINLVRNNQGNN